MSEHFSEEWRAVIGYEDVYEVSNFGRIRNRKTDRILRTYLSSPRSKTSNGYYRVILSKEGHVKNFPVHRLVAVAFIPPIPGKDCVDHIDGDSTNNYATNLRWVTHKENINNPVTLERQRAAHRTVTYRAKLRERNLSQEHKDKCTAWLRTEVGQCKHKAILEKAHQCRKRRVMCIETGIIYESVKAAALANNMSSEAITQSCNLTDKGRLFTGKYKGKVSLHFKRYFA